MALVWSLINTRKIPDTHTINPVGTVLKDGLTVLSAGSSLGILSGAMFVIWQQNLNDFLFMLSMMLCLMVPAMLVPFVSIQKIRVVDSSATD